MNLAMFQSGIATDLGAESGESRFRDFVAIQDVPPQKTLFLSVAGKLLVSNPGITVELTYAIPQGINPTILILEANLVQRPGMWPQVMTWKEAVYRSGPIDYDQYKSVTVRAFGQHHSFDVVDRA